MTFLAILAIAFALSFITEWMTGWGVFSARALKRRRDTRDVL